MHNSCQIYGHVQTYLPKHFNAWFAYETISMLKQKGTSYSEYINDLTVAFKILVLRLIYAPHQFSRKVT